MPPESANRTYLAGLVGAGIQHSSSPSMHMDEGQSLGLQISYELFDLDLLPGGATGLAAVLDQAEQRGFTGINVTYPSKQAVIPLLHELSPEARALGSVNTVLFRSGRRIGHNTDWWGYAESFRREMTDVNQRRIVLVGAGGAGAAVCYAMLKSGTQELGVHDLDRSRAAALAERMSGLFDDRKVTVCEDVRAALATADGLVHATPTGMQKYPGIPVPAECLRPPLWVAEIVYVPLLTELLRAARQHGCRTLDGDGMAVFQGAMAFTLFFGVNPDAARMQRRFHSKLATAAA
jgi:shikimate dehydrogenase